MPSPTHLSLSLCTVLCLAEPSLLLTRTILLTSIFTGQPSQQLLATMHTSPRSQRYCHHRDRITGLCKPLLWLPSILRGKPQITNMVFKTCRTLFPFAFQSPTIQGFWFSNVPGICSSHFPTDASHTLFSVTPATTPGWVLHALYHQVRCLSCSGD